MPNKVFAKFMFERQHAYEGRIGRKVSVTEFAELLGENQGNVSHWLRGTRVPGDRVLRKLADNPIIGPGVWEAAGKIEALTPPLRLILGIVSRLPVTEQERIAQELEQLARNEEEAESHGSPVTA